MVSLTCDIIGLVITFPVMIGYISLCTKVSVGMKCELSHLFEFFSSGERLSECYTFLLKKIPEVFLKLCVPFIIAYAITGYGTALIREKLPDAAKIISPYIPLLHFSVMIIAAFLAVYLAGGIILSVLGFCTEANYKYTAAEKRYFLALRLSFLPLFVLSVLTFGVLILAYTLPFTLVVYSLFVSEKNGMENASENMYDTRIFDIPNPGQNGGMI